MIAAELGVARRRWPACHKERIALLRIGAPPTTSGSDLVLFYFLQRITRNRRDLTYLPQVSRRISRSFRSRVRTAA